MGTELTIKLDGKERKLLLNLNVVREFEKATGKNFWNIGVMTGSDSLALAWAMLRQEEETLSQHAVGAMITGDKWKELDDKIAILIREALPAEDKKKKTPLAPRR